MKEIIIKIMQPFQIVGLAFLSFSLVYLNCTKPDDKIVFGPDNADPYPAHRNVAVLDSLQPLSALPTQGVTLVGSGFDSLSPEKNFVVFDGIIANITESWPESLKVQVPLRMPIDYFFNDSVEVKVSLQGSLDWSNSITFIYKPLTAPYFAETYPANHPEDKFTKPRGMASDNEGNLYLMNARLRSIYKDTPDIGDRTVYAFGGRFEGGMRMGPDGFLYAAGNSNNVIYKIPPGGGSYEEWASVPSPWGMDFDEAGNLYVIDKSNGHLYKISSDADTTKIAEIAEPGEKEYCRIFNGHIYVNGGISGNYYKMEITETGVDSVQIIEVFSDGYVGDLTFKQDGMICFAGKENSKSSYFVMDQLGKVSALAEFRGNLSFLTANDDFLYIANLTGPVYSIFLLDAVPAPYYGR